MTTTTGFARVDSLNLRVSTVGVGFFFLDRRADAYNCFRNPVIGMTTDITAALAFYAACRSTTVDLSVCEEGT